MYVWSVLECVSDDNGRVFGQMHAYVPRYVHTYILTYIHTYIWVLVTELESCKDVLLARKDFF